MPPNEITGWRDQELSLRHRAWGDGCPCVDIDFLVVEYNYATPAALIEYKKYTAPVPNLNSPSYKSLKKLADNSSIPFIIAMYYPVSWAFKVTPVNEYAKNYYDEQYYTEREFVEILYQIRYNSAKKAFVGNLNDKLPAGLC